ncbi:MAG: hypothetical protein OEM82_10645 [Acidobacteriota bacterium]|nr:hypothetical protein [Acidobacteriota bacterium]MDH3530933.1 hypothetical protein [Acidobacteriota bacterium]
MNVYKVSVLLLSSLFFIACDTDAIAELPRTNDSSSESVKDVYDGEAEGDLAKDNFDLLAVGSLLDEAEDGAEFERLLNKNEGINNLDLNGDGFVDYVSVEEFEDRADDQRGFTLLSRFGPDDVQEIASIILGRDRPDRSGATFYVQGNDQIYGNNYGYQGNWLDKTLKIASWAFGSRDNYYRSPYYYDNYPDYYRTYRVIGTPVYRNRVYKYQVNPAMTKITTPFGKIKIKSRYPGRSYRRVHARLVNPTREQLIFYKNERGKFKDQKSKDKNGPDKGSKGKDNGPGKGSKAKDNGPGDGSDKQVDKPGKRGVDTKPGKDNNRGNGKGNGKPPAQKDNDKKGGKPDKGPKMKGGGKGKGKNG